MPFHAFGLQTRERCVPESKAGAFCHWKVCSLKTCSLIIGLALDAYTAALVLLQVRTHQCKASLFCNDAIGVSTSIEVVHAKKQLYSAHPF